MIDIFVILPILVGIVAITRSGPMGDLGTLVVVAVPVFLCLAFSAAWSTVDRVTQYEVGIRRRRELLFFAKKSKRMMLYWNPVGWLVCLGYFLIWKKVFAPCAGIFGSIWEQAFPRETE
ncbi:MAG: hypothetical protein WAV50_03770 [Minisyncoccia bacterium]